MNPKDQTEKNIRAIYDREQRELAKVPAIHKVANAIAGFSGTVLFVGLNALFFLVWMTLNLTVTKFDPYPFTLLTMIVSLESIFLSTFVLISQNQLAQQTEARHKLDLQVNLLTEQESTGLINVVLLMAKKMGIPDEQLETLRQMADDTSPEDVLRKIEKIENET